MPLDDLPGRRDVSPDGADDPGAVGDGLGLLDAVLDAVPDIVHLKDPSGRFVQVNRAAAEFLGLSLPSEAVGRCEADWLPGDHADRAREADAAVLTTGAHADERLECVERPGRPPTWLMTTRRPLRGADGTPIGILTVSRDITEQHAVEQSLRVSQDRFRRIVEAAPLGAHLYQLLPDDRLVFLGANPAASRMLGTDCAQFVGLTIEEAFPPLLETEVPAAYRQVARTGEPWFTEHIEYADGRIQGAYEVHAFQTEPGLMAALFLDITDRRRMEEELRLTQFVLDHMSEAAFRIRPDGSIAYANETACRLSGYTREELLTMSVPEIDPHFAPENWQPHWQELREHGAVRLEGILRSRDGREVPIEVAANHVVFGGQELNCAFARDLTERKAAEEQRAQLEAQVQHAQKLESLVLLAGGIAHDFTTILMGVLGNAALALSQLPLEAPARACVEQVETAALRAADLAKQMLAYSGKGRFVIECLDLSRLVEEMSHLLEASISKKALLRRQFAASPALVRGDATQLRQVVMNLITNASDALGEEQGVITVRTSIIEVDSGYLASTYIDDELPAGRYALLEVADTGCGMDAATRSRMFDPFFSTKRTGRGLGMAAALGIIRGHGGGLKVYTEPGAGTSIKVLLPCAEPGAAAPPPDEAPPAREAALAGLVLIADDEPLVRQVARLALEMAGFRVLEAGDGLDALEQYRKHVDSVVAVVLDMSMPRMGGAEAFREIRRENPDVPVILSSGFNEQDTTQDLVGRGVAGFIQKPYRPTELIDKIRAVAAHGRS